MFLYPMKFPTRRRVHPPSADGTASDAATGQSTSGRDELPLPLSPADRATLADVVERYCPTILFHSCETLFPTSVTEFVAHSTINNTFYLVPPPRRLARHLARTPPARCSVPPPIYALVWPGRWDGLLQRYIIQGDWLESGDFIVSYFVFFPLSARPPSRAGPVSRFAARVRRLLRLRQWVVGDVKQVMLHFRNHTPTRPLSVPNPQLRASRACHELAPAHDAALQSYGSESPCTSRPTLLHTPPSAPRVWHCRHNIVLLEPAQWAGRSSVGEESWLHMFVNIGQSRGLLSHPPFSAALDLRPSERRPRSPTPEFNLAPPLMERTAQKFCRGAGTMMGQLAKSDAALAPAAAALSAAAENPAAAAAALSAFGAESGLDAPARVSALTAGVATKNVAAMQGFSLCGFSFDTLFAACPAQQHSSLWQYSQFLLDCAAAAPAPAAQVHAPLLPAQFALPAMQFLDMAGTAPQLVRDQLPGVNLTDGIIVDFVALLRSMLQGQSAAGSVPDQARVAEFVFLNVTECRRLVRLAHVVFQTVKDETVQNIADVVAAALAQADADPAEPCPATLPARKFDVLRVPRDDVATLLACKDDTAFTNGLTKMILDMFALPEGGGWTWTLTNKTHMFFFNLSRVVF